LVQDPLPLDRDLPADAKAIAQALNALSGGLDQRLRTAALSNYTGLSAVLGSCEWAVIGGRDWVPLRIHTACVYMHVFVCMNGSMHIDGCMYAHVVRSVWTPQSNK
jgi:hypothetical protein